MLMEDFAGARIDKLVSGAMMVKKMSGLKMAKVDEFAGEKLARSPVYGTKFMVVSGHSLASTAGVRTLESGGSLIDAMIVTSSVLCTVLPHATSFGGDAFIIYYDAKSKKILA